MLVRNAIAAVTVAALALTLSACTSDPAPTTSADPTTSAPSPTASGEPTAAPTNTPPAGEIREVTEGFHLEGVGDVLRQGFPSYAEKSNEEIEVILNAACDAMDAQGTPESGAEAIESFGIETYDAAFSVSAAIQLYCPEYQIFLQGSIDN